jgi:RNA polymerase sigma-70 factor (ECF subfamily)
LGYTPLDFAALFDTHHPRLYAYIRSQVADRETAEDLTAVAFERAFRHSHRYDPSKGAFATWLFRIARNLVLNHYAATSRKPAHFQLDDAVEISATEILPEQQLLRQEQNQALLAAMAALSERDREIVYLRFFGHLTNRKIAEILDLNEKTVSVTILRALQKLKIQLEAQEPS